MHIFITRMMKETGAVVGSQTFNKSLLESLSNSDWPIWQSSRFALFCGASVRMPAAALVS